MPVDRPGSRALAATKFARHGPSNGISAKNSPSTHENSVFRPFWACWASFFALAPTPCRAGRAFSRTGHGRTSNLKGKPPLHEVLRAVVKHFSPTRVHKSQFWPFSTEQGRYFFHGRRTPGTGAIRWGDISFKTRPRRPTDPPIRTRRTRHQQPGSAGVKGAGRPGRGAGGRRHGQNKQTRTKPRPIGGRRAACGAWTASQAPPVWRVPEGPEGPGCSAHGRWRGVAGQRAYAPCQWLAARTARGRAAAHGHTKQPGPTQPAPGTPAAPQAPPEHGQKETPTAPETP